MRTWEDRNRLVFHGDKVMEKRVPALPLGTQYSGKTRKQNLSTHIALTLVLSKVFLKLFPRGRVFLTNQEWSTKKHKNSIVFLQKDFLMFFNSSFLCVCMCGACIYIIYRIIKYDHNKLYI